MIETVKAYIEENQLFNNEKRIVIGVSGGIDSMTLLHILHRLGYDITVAHINHNVRSESEAEYSFVMQYSQELGVKFVGTKLPKITKGNFHQEARTLRYQFLQDVAEKEQAVLVTAHHLDDQVETILMKLIRGSNLFGYAGIKNQIVVNNMLIARPLLCLTRKDIIKYAQENKVPYMNDASNDSDKYTRNKLRHHIIPTLVADNPQLYQTFMDYSKQILASFDHLRKEAEKIVINEKIPVQTYCCQDLAVRNEVIAYLLQKHNINNIKNKLTAIDSLMMNSKPNSSIKIQDDLLFQKEYNWAFIVPVYSNEDFSITITEFGDYEISNHRMITFSNFFENNHKKYIKMCYNNCKLPLTVRNRRNGDYIEFKYGTKKIKDIFIDKKIPVSERDTMPVVTDCDGNILGIIGVCSAQEVIENPVYLFLKE